MFKKSLLVSMIMLFLFAASLQAQKLSNGIGVRLGDPSGVTYKKYFNDRSALEFLLGSSPRLWHDNYYENGFDRRSKFDRFGYRGHDVRSTVYLGARYLIHNDLVINTIDGDLQWYWGVGLLLKSAQVRYSYRDADQVLYTETVNDFDFGPEGLIGLEYTMKELPIGFFADVSLMIEFADRFSLRTFGGIGARYRF